MACALIMLGFPSSPRSALWLWKALNLYVKLGDPHIVGVGMVHNRAQVVDLAPGPGRAGIRVGGIGGAALCGIGRGVVSLRATEIISAIGL